MSNMIFVIPVLLVVAISAFVVKIATIALRMTGLNERTAHFQALSAFTGTGFTTHDSELVLENNTRRNIIMVLMIFGNAGLVTVITTLVISFGRGNMPLLLTNAGIVLVVLFMLFKIFTHKGIERFVNDKIEAGLEKSSSFRKRPIEEIVRIAKNYGIAEVNIRKNYQDTGKTLSESSFRENDILILAIERENTVIPAPKATDRISINDTLICYGKLSSIERIIRNE